MKWRVALIPSFILSLFFIIGCQSVASVSGVSGPNPVQSVIAQDDEIEFINEEEGGLVSITGVMTYTNVFFTAGVAQPLVILEDQTGFVNRDRKYLFPEESQVLGQLTSDFFTSPVSYSMVLPIEPKGAQSDVDNDGEDEAGVQIFAVAYWDNTYGGAFLEERDQGGGGWSTAYASTVTSTDLETEREIVGGKLVVFAPDDEQSFPIDFGEDGLLFTDDDENMVDLPAGYTVVDLDTSPFTFDRSARQVIDLIEPEGAALLDFGDLTYPEAFDALVEEFRVEYAFSDIKGVDWDELSETYRPLFEEAEESGSVIEYQRALRDFLWNIPDGHVSGPVVIEDFREAINGGIGLGIRDVDDGRTIVNYLLEGAPAAEAGLSLGDEIVAINGVDIDEWVDASIAYSAPFSTDHVRRLQKLRYATRFPADSTVEITFINEDGDEETVEMDTVPEFDSFSQSSFFTGRTGLELPVQWELTDEGYVKAEITDFLDNGLLTVQLWERLMTNLNDNQVPVLILDMRQNGGGFGFLADNMSAYFFDESVVTGNVAKFDEEAGEFIIKPEDADNLILPDEALRYRGDVVVLVGPACASACEFFSHNMTLNDRAVIVGQYPTAGLGGSVEQLRMPEGEQVRYTTGRAVDAEGNIHIEGIGVVPDFVVPVTEEGLLGGEDVVLQAAIELIESGEIADFLEAKAEAAEADADDEPEESDEGDAGESDADEDEEAPADDGEIEIAGVVELGEPLVGEVEVGESTYYAFEAEEGQVVDMIVRSGDLSTYDPLMRIYTEDGEQLLENDDISSKSLNAGFEELEIPFDVVLIIEVTSFDGSSGGDFTLVVEESE